MFPLRTIGAIFLLVHGIVGEAFAQTSTFRVATGISRPVFAVAPPGDTGRLFITEQHTGRIEILDLGTDTISGTPFLDLSGLATANEQGLLGLAFDPDYANNGYFYVNVTTTGGAFNKGVTRIRRYTVVGDPATSDVASLASEFEILSFDQPQTNHNGGWIGFSPNDGYLYIGSGDGGGSDDNDSGHTSGTGNAQDTTNNLLGKMLRIDVTGDDFPGDATRNYSIPSDNPFVSISGDDEIWAYGLRNPFRSSFDRANGNLCIGDVGQGHDGREEIDYQLADSTGGENYGWRLREGTILTPSGGVGGAPPPDNVEPIHDYEHGSGTFDGHCVIGGYVYRGPVEAFRGHYFFADYETDNIWKLDPDAVIPGNSVMNVIGDLLPDAGNIRFISSFGEDDEGNLYITDINGGELFRIVTASEDIVWNGDDASAGSAGDGTTWGSADNWTRGGTPDVSYVDEDHVIFAAGSSKSNIDLGATRTVSAATFEAPYTLLNNTFRILSGNLDVETGVTATINSTLEAESAAHSLRKLGSGTLHVEGVAGQMVVKEGTLGGNGTLDYLTVRNGGTVAPSTSIGILNVDNSFTMEAGATLSVELGGTDTNEFDQLLVGDEATLAGTLNIDRVDPYVPQTGDMLPILDASGGVSGTFSEVNNVYLSGGLTFNVIYNANDVTLEVVAASLLGDFNLDGQVDGSDLNGPVDGWKARYGVDLDGSDFLDWQRNFGAVLLQASASNTAVHEPESLTLDSVDWQENPGQTVDGFAFLHWQRQFAVPTAAEELAPAMLSSSSVAETPLPGHIPTVSAPSETDSTTAGPAPFVTLPPAVSAWAMSPRASGDTSLSLIIIKAKLLQASKEIRQGNTLRAERRLQGLLSELKEMLIDTAETDSERKRIEQLVESVKKQLAKIDG